MTLSKRTSVIWTFITVVFSTLSLPDLGYAQAVDFNTFSSEAYTESDCCLATPNWTVTGGGTSVTIPSGNNPQASYFYSPDNLLDTFSPAALRLRIDNNADDDFIGIVLGFTPGDTTNTSADHLVLVWRDANQNGPNFNGGPLNNLTGQQTSPIGLRLVRVSGTPSTDENWGLINDAGNTNGGVSVLATATNLGSTGYGTGTSHFIDIQYSPTEIVVEVDDVEEIRVSGTFPNGRYGPFVMAQNGTDFVNLVLSDPATCGNGTIEGSEACDDGNTSGLDGCNFGCEVEIGRTCLGSPSICGTSPAQCFRSGTVISPTFGDAYNAGSAILDASAGVGSTTYSDFGGNNEIDVVVIRGSASTYDATTGAMYPPDPGAGTETITMSFFDAGTTDAASVAGLILQTEDHELNEFLDSFSFTDAYSITHTISNAASENQRFGNTSIFSGSTQSVNSNGDWEGTSAHTAGIQTGRTGTINLSSFLVRSVTLTFKRTAPSTNFGFRFGPGSTLQPCPFNAYVSVKNPELLWNGAEAFVRFETEGEVGALAMDLQRFDAGAWQSVGGVQPVLGLRDSQGGSYQFRDPNVTDEVSAQRYRIIETDVLGRKVLREEFSVTPKFAVPSLDNLQIPRRVLKKARTRLPQKGRELPYQDGQVERGASAGVVLETLEEGIQRVSPAELAESAGWDLEETKARVNSGRLRLTEQGRLRFWRTNASGEMVFFSRRNDGPYADAEVFIVTKTETAQAGEERGRGVDLPVAELLTHELHIEKNKFAAVVLPSDPDGDYWYWGVMASKDSPDARVESEFSLFAEPAGDVTVHVDTFGLLAIGPESPVGADIELNGRVVGSVRFETPGQGETVIVLPKADFRVGENTLALVSDETLPNGSFSGAYIDAVRLEVPTSPVGLESFSGNVKATSSGKYCLGGEGLLPTVYGQEDGVPLQVDESGCFLADAEEAFFVEMNNTPERIVRARGLRSVRPARGNYVIVTPEALRPAAERLASLRQSDGYDTSILSLEAALDTWSHGYPDPAAILAALPSEGTGALVLMGDGHFDYLGRLGPRAIGVPVQMISTPDGLFASDAGLADTDGDGVPNWQVGRLPFQSLEEGEGYLDALQQYRMSRGEEMRVDTLLFSGRVKNAHFGLANERLRSKLRPTWRTHVLTRSERATPAADSAALVAQLTKGVRWAHYQGHGGMEHLDDPDYLSVSQEAEGQVAFLSVAGCIAGRFEFPGFDSIADALVRRRQALAVYSPSGLTPGSHTEVVSGALADAFRLAESGAEDSAPRVGTIIQSLWDSGKDRPRVDVLKRYNLLGDPALRLYPAGEVASAGEEPSGTPSPSSALGGKAPGGCAAANEASGSLLFWGFLVASVFVFRRGQRRA